MNITEETNDYYNSAKSWNNFVKDYQDKIRVDGINTCNSILEDCNANSGPTEKLKTRNICLYGAPEWLFKVLSKKKK